MSWWQWQKLQQQHEQSQQQTNKQTSKQTMTNIESLNVKLLIYTSTNNSGIVEYIKTFQVVTNSSWLVVHPNNKNKDYRVRCRSSQTFLTDFWHFLTDLSTKSYFFLSNFNWNIFQLTFQLSRLISQLLRITWVTATSSFVI